MYALAKAVVLSRHVSVYGFSRGRELGFNRSTGVDCIGDLSRVRRVCEWSTYMYRVRAGIAQSL